jgi:hypothetical protein
MMKKGKKMKKVMVRKVKKKVIMKILRRKRMNTKTKMGILLMASNLKGGDSHTKEAHRIIETQGIININLIILEYII